MQNQVTAVPRPIKNRVLIKADAARDKIGSIYTPQGSEEYPVIGTVAAIGSLVTDVKVGDRVLFKRMPKTALNNDTREGIVEAWRDMLMLKVDDILAVLDEA